MAYYLRPSSHGKKRAQGPSDAWIVSWQQRGRRRNKECDSYTAAVRFASRLRFGQEMTLRKKNA